MRVLRIAIAGLYSVTALVFIVAAEPPYNPPVAKSSDEGQKAIKRFRTPAGMETKLWAAEPLLANPVAFCFDEQGRCYVAETFRLHFGVTDNRKHMYWLDDDIACRTVADRVAMHKKHAKDKFESTYEKEHDRVKLVWDSQAKGIADKSSVFADGFRHAADGLGSGVLAHQGNIYYTCIPDLWLLKDTQSKHTVDIKKSLAYGFGVHVAFLGHDMHGLIIGPDGRLYFSIGDRGLNVKNKEGKHLFLPDCGAVLRCELDGSNLEIVHYGLRNPQELAFDNYGNLFTVDNNSDSGDKARLVQIVEGADSGWRMNYQYGTALGDRGPWNAEKLWHLPHEGQPAHIIPPLAHISAGPSGLCFDPGATALPEKHRGRFFLSDFRGGSGGSGVWSFAIKPKGASFELGEHEQFIWSILATDCDFGPDGGFYISDWVEGWNLTGKGRIYRFADAEANKNPLLAETKQLLGQGFNLRNIEDFVKLLGHADRRVRQGAQFALADRGKDALPKLLELSKLQAQSPAERWRRLHALWALGQLSRRQVDGAQAGIIAAAGDHDSEARAQAAKLLDQLDADEDAVATLTALLRDAEPRVRFFAVQSLGKIAAQQKEKGQRHAVVELRKLADDSDPYVRHAVPIALGRLQGRHVLNPTDDLFTKQTLSPAVRLATLLAVRREGTIGAAAFIDDPDHRIVMEAVRALHDAPGEFGLPWVAKLISARGQPEPLLLRALNANFRLGEKKHAEAVARFAADGATPVKLRVEAVKILGDWAKPSPRDRVLGDWRPLDARDGNIAANAMRQNLGGIFAGPAELRTEAARVAARLGIKEVGKTLADLLTDASQPPETRAAALRALGELKDERMPDLVAKAVGDGDPRVRAVGLTLLIRSQPGKIGSALTPALESGSILEQQAALALLAEFKTPDADELLERWFQRMLDDKAPAGLRLEIVEAAQARNSERWKRKLATYQERFKNEPLGAWREALAGGDAIRGRDIFFNKSAVSCVRCHKVQGQGGEVGPELFGLAAKQNREYLLEALALPDKQIAKRFDTVVLELNDGKTLTGVFRSEDATEIKLMSAEGTLLTVPKARVEERRRGKSAMPEDLVQKLSRRELRDLVEYLAGLK